MWSRRAGGDGVSLHERPRVAEVWSSVVLRPSLAPALNPSRTVFLALIISCLTRCASKVSATSVYDTGDQDAPRQGITSHVDRIASLVDHHVSLESSTIFSLKQRSAAPSVVRKG